MDSSSQQQQAQQQAEQQQPAADNPHLARMVGEDMQRWELRVRSYERQVQGGWAWLRVRTCMCA